MKITSKDVKLGKITNFIIKDSFGNLVTVIGIPQYYTGKDDGAFIFTIDGLAKNLLFKDIVEVKAYTKSITPEQRALLNKVYSDREQGIMLVTELCSLYQLQEPLINEESTIDNFQSQIFINLSPKSQQYFLPFINRGAFTIKPVYDYARTSNLMVLGFKIKTKFVYTNLDKNRETTFGYDKDAAMARIVKRVTPTEIPPFPFKESRYSVKLSLTKAGIVVNNSMDVPYSDIMPKVPSLETAKLFAKLIDDLIIEWEGSLVW